MGQARDSLQAYITAVYFCPAHVETWTDIGLLYESCDQLMWESYDPKHSYNLIMTSFFVFSDAYLCYTNGVNVLQKKEKTKNKTTSFEGVHEILSTRVRFVEHQMQQNGGMVNHMQQNRWEHCYHGYCTYVLDHTDPVTKGHQLVITSIPLWALNTCKYTLSYSFTINVWFYCTRS